MEFNKLKKALIHINYPLFLVDLLVINNILDKSFIHNHSKPDTMPKKYFNQLNNDAFLISFYLSMAS